MDNRVRVVLAERRGVVSGLETCFVAQAKLPRSMHRDVLLFNSRPQPTEFSDDTYCTINCVMRNFMAAMTESGPGALPC